MPYTCWMCRRKCRFSYFINS